MRHMCTCDDEDDRCMYMCSCPCVAYAQGGVQKGVSHAIQRVAHVMCMCCVHVMCDADMRCASYVVSRDAATWCFVDVLFRMLMFDMCADVEIEIVLQSTHIRCHTTRSDEQCLTHIISITLCTCHGTHGWSQSTHIERMRVDST